MTSPEHSHFSKLDNDQVASKEQKGSGSLGHASVIEQKDQLKNNTLSILTPPNNPKSNQVITLLGEQITLLAGQIRKHKKENARLEEENTQLMREKEYDDNSIKALHEDIKALQAEVRYLNTLLGEANIDKLTGLLNRQSFEDHAFNKINELSRSGSEISLLLIDIDNFKPINDNYGHPAGDKVLKYLGNLLSNNTRKLDIVGRHGGEEFIVLLPNTDINGAQELGEKLRKAIESDLHKSLSGKIKESEPITGSIGIYSTYIEKGNQSKNTSDILERCITNADEALYKAKNGGKNRIEIYEEEK